MKKSKLAQLSLGKAQKRLVYFWCVFDMANSNFIQEQALPNWDWLIKVWVSPVFFSVKLRIPYFLKSCSMVIEKLVMWVLAVYIDFFVQRTCISVES